MQIFYSLKGIQQQFLSYGNKLFLFQSSRINPDLFLFFFLEKLVKFIVLFMKLSLYMVDININVFNKTIC